MHTYRHGAPNMHPLTRNPTTAESKRKKMQQERNKTLTFEKKSFPALPLPRLRPLAPPAPGSAHPVQQQPPYY